MTNPHIAAIAQTLIAARRDRQPADPAQHVDQLQSTDDAYAVQELVRNELAPEQAAVGRYWKSGASSKHLWNRKHSTWHLRWAGHFNIGWKHFCWLCRRVFNYWNTQYFCWPKNCYWRWGWR